jgi:cytidine deaminase
MLSPNLLAGAIDSQTIYVDENDMNPLKPCGACHEWLKKIAEVNPSFSVVTFTDHQCEGVYIEQIWE